MKISRFDVLSFSFPLSSFHRLSQCQICCYSVLTFYLIQLFHSAFVTLDIPFWWTLVQWNKTKHSFRWRATCLRWTLVWSLPWACLCLRWVSSWPVGSSSTRSRAIVSAASSAKNSVWPAAHRCSSDSECSSCWSPSEYTSDGQRSSMHRDQWIIRSFGFRCYCCSLLLETSYCWCWSDEEESLLDEGVIIKCAWLWNGKFELKFTVVQDF